MTRIVLLLVLPLAVQADPILTVPCKRNVKDGKIVVLDLPALPNNYHWTVLQYISGPPTDGAWNYGQCKVEKLHG